MFIGNDCIDTIPVDHKLVRIPGYLSHFVRTLRAKHKQLLLQFNTEPEFLLHGISTNTAQQIIKLSDDCLQMANRNGLKKAV